MLRTAWQPLRARRQIRAKQSADFPHNSVYSPQNHVDTSFLNMSEMGSHKWARGQAKPLKFGVGLRRPRHKRHRRALASFASGKRVGGTQRVGRKTVHGKKENQNRDPDTTVWHLWPTLADSAAERYNRWMEDGLFLRTAGRTRVCILLINLSCSKTWMYQQTESYAHSLDLFIGVRGTPLCRMLIHPTGLWKTPRDPKCNQELHV